MAVSMQDNYRGGAWGQKAILIFVLGDHDIIIIIISTCHCQCIHNNYYYKYVSNQQLLLHALKVAIGR